MVKWVKTYTLTVDFPTACGSFFEGTTPDHKEAVVLEVDLTRLASILGKAAIASKSGRASSAGGLVRARHVRHASRIQQAQNAPETAGAERGDLG